MIRGAIVCLWLSGCGGLAWNTTLADDAGVRSAMLASVVPGRTTEGDVKARWGNPTQKIREGAQVTYVYRNMSNPPGPYALQFGDSTAYVLIEFQYGIATEVRTPEIEGCRSTFPPRPPGPGFDNPSTVKPVNCGTRFDGGTGGTLAVQRPDVTSDSYGAQQGKYR